jgi:hypothetical protein
LRRFSVTSEPETACPKENSFSANNWDKVLIANPADFAKAAHGPNSSSKCYSPIRLWQVTTNLGLLFRCWNMGLCMCNRLVILALVLAPSVTTVGCSSSKQELPSKEKIQQQLKRNAEMRDAEDRAEKEGSAKR